MPTLMACSHGTMDPASRFRVLQYFPYLEQAGWQVSHRPNRPPRDEKLGFGGTARQLLCSPYGKWMRRRHRRQDLRDAQHFDVIFLNRDLLAGEVIWEQRLLSRNPRVIFDFDDAIFLGEKKRSHIEWICRNAAWVTAGNESLADFARRVTPNVTVLPTVVDAGKYTVKNYSQPHSGPLRIGWMGSGHSIRQTLYPYLEMLAGLQREIGFEFKVVTSPRPRFPKSGLRWTHIEWNPEVELRIADLFDIGIMPLVDDAFQQGKCGLKLLQYMAAGLPVIASPVGVNRDIVSANGYLAASEAEWRQAVTAMDSDRKLLRDFGMAGRAFCGNYDIKNWSGVLVHLLGTVAGMPSGRDMESSQKTNTGESGGPPETPVIKFKESPLAHKWLDGLRGVEIGGSAHNPFGLNTLNVGHITDDTEHGIEQMRLCGEVLKIDVIADAGNLPFLDGEFDFVLASHVLEHVSDLIGTLREWFRVVRPGGFVFVIFPHKERTFDRPSPRTSLSDLISRQGQPTPFDRHWTIWTPCEAGEVLRWMGLKVVEWQDPDDKVGNGFTFVIQK